MCMPNDSRCTTRIGLCDNIYHSLMSNVYNEPMYLLPVYILVSKKVADCVHWQKLMICALRLRIKW